MQRLTVRDRAAEEVVCLGDDPDAASPIFDMPEWGNDEFRFTSNEEIWNADYHTSKF